MKNDFVDAILPYYAEIIAGDIPDRIRELRFLGIRRLQSYLGHYQKLGYAEKLLYAIAEKKGRLICSVSSRTEMEKLLKPRCPHYDGNKFISDEFCIPEEELICWSETSLQAPLNEAGFRRYMELFSQVFPTEYGQIFGKAE
ncbi:hypothetical protein D3Z47_02275 [Lachnospiraceae bacterium]|nr:hypothetical protein [Lachnospiraceae bacterium]